MRTFLLVALVGAFLPLAAANEPFAFTLPNGLRVVLLEDHATPLVRASLRVTWAPTEEPAGREGLGDFLATLLERAGPGFQSRLEFDRAQAASGVRMRFRSFPGGVEWQASARSSDQEAALQGLAQQALRTLPEGPTVEALRLSTSRSLEAALPVQLARRRFLGSLQGFPPLEEAALVRLGLRDLEAFHQRVIRPGHAVLGLTGDLSPTQARTQALLHFGTWGQGPDSGRSATEVRPGFTTTSVGPAEAWLGGRLPSGSTQTLACLELLVGILSARPDSPLHLDPDGVPYLLSRRACPSVDALPAAVQELRNAWAELPVAITPVSLALAKAQWLREEALLPLNPGRQLDRSMARTLGRAASPEAVASVTLADVQALLASGLGAPQLLLTGVPKGTAIAWAKTLPVFAPWVEPQASTPTPKRETKSR